MDSTRALDSLKNRQPDIAILDIVIKGDMTGNIYALYVPMCLRKTAWE